ncbi:MAG TPA: Zn-ribbon domain-containing OB-fold protein [Burkholderiaceae bacterium]|nr:Zn-ribbon domain-containing OB-fold protein [Burkholderiaceae bacterium]
MATDLSSPGITLPAITPLTRPFWDACSEGRLILPRCNGCQQYFFRPEVACTHCFATDWRWVDASGRATLYSYSIVHRAPAPGFKTPYVFAIVELEEGVTMFSNIVGCEPEDVRIGMALEVIFEKIAPGVHLPKFRPATVSARS